MFLAEYFQRDLEVAGLSKALDDLTTHENENVKKRALIILTRIKAHRLAQQEWETFRYVFHDNYTKVNAWESLVSEIQFNSILKIKTILKKIRNKIRHFFVLRNTDYVGKLFLGVYVL